MLDVSDELKLIYKNDIVPLVPKLAYKNLILYFPELDLTITNNQIHSESFYLTESICSGEELVFGGCESNMVEIKVANVTQDITGKKMIVTQIVSEIYEMSLGEFKVASAELVDDLGHKQIIAYDYSKYAFDKDVAEWYENLVFPMTLKSFRTSFFAHIGLEIEPQTLVNDDLSLSKTIEPTTLKALDVAVKIGELNGAFGNMSRLGKFRYIQLKPSSLYPSEDLYPSETLFPSESSEYIGTAGYISTKYEEYTVKGIDCLQIRQEEGDVGSVVFDSADYKNPYIITGNFLVYGKNASQLEMIGRKVFNEIKGLEYRPHTTTLLGLPYLEVGDSVAIMKNTDTMESFIFSRTLKGIQVLRDEISAQGNEYRDNTVSPNMEIQILKGKSLLIEKNVDGLGIKVSDLEVGYTEVGISVEGLEIAVSDLEVGLTEIGVTAQGISTKVSDLEGNYSAISQSVSSISSDVYDLEGNYSSLRQTVNGFTFTNSSGQTRISGSTIETGILKSVSILFTKADSVFFSAGGSSLTGSGYEWRLDSNAFYSAGKTIELNRNNGNIVCSDVYINDPWVNGWGLVEMLKDIYNKLP